MIAEAVEIPAWLLAYPLLRLGVDVLILILLVVLLARHHNAGFPLMLVSTVLSSLLAVSASLGVTRFGTDADSAMMWSMIRTAVSLTSRGIFAIGLILLLRHRWRRPAAAVATAPAAPPMPEDA